MALSACNLVQDTLLAAFLAMNFVFDSPFHSNLTLEYSLESRCRIVALIEHCPLIFILDFEWKITRIQMAS